MVNKRFRLIDTEMSRVMITFGNGGPLGET